MCACAARPIRETYVREIDGPVLYSYKRKAEIGREGDLSYSVRDLSYSGGHLGVI